ncbi:MAG: M20/M25/M40 family metallo-hydrolase [Lentisphaeria bacterium]|nr:M20/M25/M40 family metallo-hydrolase [Lentisphaeria bacterium]
MQTMINDILAKTREPGFADSLKDLLMEICEIDTTPRADVSIMRDAESAVFDILERRLDACPFPGARRERRKVNPEIAQHPAYSQLHFTKTDEKPEGVPPEEAYAERGNLLYFVPGADGYEGADGVALNAHIDVVKPFMPPRYEDGIVYGRGSCDDKGAIVAMIAALTILSQTLEQHGKSLKKNLVNMFVIEEETGGNGSLSLALDRELKQLFNSILVLECTGNEVHPANRGAIWYRADLHCEGVNLFELFAYVIEQFEQEGRAIKAESRHSLFPQRPVQTCHGIVGHYGEHPSRICGEVAFTIALDGEVTEKTEACITDAIESALAEYLAVYGDKTKDIDPTTQKPKVDHHYDLACENGVFRCDVHGSTGHMGSILENDGAITKMACFARALVRSKAKIAELSGGAVTLALADEEPAQVLTLEGGQGFVPTHTIEDVMERVAIAGQRGAENYLRIIGCDAKSDGAVEVTYDKLHNAAFDGDPDSPAMHNAIAAAKNAGMWKDQEIMGWTVSCDSRLFATEYPDMSVLTSGAGHLMYAHGDAEQLRIDELVTSVGFVAVYLLREAGLAE